MLSASDCVYAAQWHACVLVIVIVCSLMQSAHAGQVQVAVVANFTAAVK